MQHGMVVHDGFATVRSARCARRDLEPLLEDELPLTLRPRPDVPWWELAIRRSRHRSFSSDHPQVDRYICAYKRKERRGLKPCVGPQRAVVFVIVFPDTGQIGRAALVYYCSTHH
ncbi:hypothetical protein J6590_006839 [Homalodisca vitripennis]|nr:hypothetical protein J6590_006839 [Homalodisca vitripennis]